MNICWPFMPSDPGNTADGPLGLSPGCPLRLATGLPYLEAPCCCGAGVTYRVTGKLQRRAACLQDLPRDLSLLVWTPWGSSETMRPLSAGRFSGLQLWERCLWPGSSPPRQTTPKVRPHSEPWDVPLWRGVCDLGLGPEAGALSEVTMPQARVPVQVCSGWVGRTF